MKKAIIFDLDGTLFNTLEDLTDSINYALKKLDLSPRTILEVKSFLGNGIKELVRLSLGEYENLLDEALIYFKQYYTIHLNDKTELYHNIIPLLENLKKLGIKMAVVSNKFDIGVKKICYPKLNKYMDVFIGETNDLRKKPEPDMIIEACKKLNVKIDEIIYVGDSEVDILTCKKNNIDLIGCDWGYRGKEIFFNENIKVVFDPLEIIDCLNNF